MGGDERFGNIFKLFCENGYNLSVKENGVIVGTQDDDDCTALLEREQAIEVGHVRLKGLSSCLYVCFDANGRLYGEENPDVEGTIFEETFAGSYNSYRSVAYPDWYLGIKKNGKAKPGPRTQWGKKSTKWLPRRHN